MSKPTYFIGYDSREHEAALVAIHSITSRLSEPSNIYLIEHRALRRLHLFTRPWSIAANGQYYDDRDGKPFSTEFSHSRFLVFHLARELGCTGPCMFVDCDWLFLRDPTAVMHEQRKHPNQIGVVTRQREIRANSTKMDGMIQQDYARKLWSAMFTFTPSAALATRFSPMIVNNQAGRDLHRFMGMEDEAFWVIDPLWHFIPSLDTRRGTALPYGIHFSEFSPWLNPEKVTDYPQEFAKWENERRRWLKDYADTNGAIQYLDIEREFKREAV